MATNIMSARFNSKAGQSTGTKEDSGPLRKIFQGLSAAESLDFPLNMEKGVDHYVSFGAYASQHFPATGQPRANESLVGKVRLPMPNQLPVAYAQTYKNTDLGPLGAAIGKAAQQEGLVGALESMDKDRIFEAGANTYEAALKNLGVSGAGALFLQGAVEGGGIAGAVGGGVVGAGIGAGLAKGVEATLASAGKAVNPHMAVIYERPQFRKFQFQYSLRPKNQKESDILKKIIFFFKYYGSPSLSGKTHFFSYPQQFKIHFKYHDYLFNLGDCVLDNLSVDYHGEGTPLYYDAKTNESSSRNLKAPANITINLDFTETVIVTKEDVEKGR